MREVNILGFKFTVGSPTEKQGGEDFETRVKSTVDRIIKGFTYDKLFTTGQMLDSLNGTRVTSPYETLSTVFKAVSAICDNVPQADLCLYRHNTREKVEDKPLQDLLDKPNPRQSKTAFRQEWAGFRALYGEAFIRKIPSIGQLAGTTMLPAQLINLDPAKVTEVKDEHTGDLIAWKYKNEYLRLEEVIHSKSFNPYNPHRGISPLKPIHIEMQIDKASLDFNLSFFRNDGTPGMFLVTDKFLTQEQRNRITEDWIKKHSGVKNAFKPEILEGGLKPQPSTLSHKEMDFISQKELARKEILGTWRVPESLFNVTKDVNYATMQGQMRIFWIYTLIPLMNQLAEDLDAHLVDMYNDAYDLAVDLTNVPAFQEELYTKVDACKKLFEVGFTGNEINTMLELGFEEKPWRDEWWVPFSMVTATDAQKYPRISEVINYQGELTPGGEKPPADPAAKPPKKSRGIAKQAAIKHFAIMQMGHEKRFESKMSRYFNELRVEALKTSVARLQHEHTVAIDWHKADDKLKKMVFPLIEESVVAGVKFGEGQVGSHKSIAEEINQHKLTAFINVKADKIVGINRTLKRQIADRLTQAAKDGNSQQMNQEQVASLLTEELRGVFKVAITRAALIARTEVGGAVNGGSLLYYRAIGIKAKSWGTAHDEHVRESHIMCEEQGSIGIDHPFTNGLQYPGDQSGDASEVCNCRCALIPEIGD